jgi:hypothetical protein
MKTTQSACQDEQFVAVNYSSEAESTLADGGPAHQGSLIGTLEWRTQLGSVDLPRRIH